MTSKAEFARRESDENENVYLALHYELIPYLLQSRRSFANRNESKNYTLYPSHPRKNKQNNLDVLEGRDLTA